MCMVLTGPLKKVTFERSGMPPDFERSILSTWWPVDVNNKSQLGYEYGSSSVRGIVKLGSKG